MGRSGAEQGPHGNGPIDHLVCVILICAAFGIVYFFSLSFVYIEGDDAQTVAYHVLGRNYALQPAYSGYQSMMDAMLGVLPARENVVRITGIGLTAICAPVLFLLIMILAFDWCGRILNIPKWTIVVVMLLAVPEFYYLGMVLTPSIIAMTFLVAAHVILRRSSRWSKRRWFGFATSTVLFGIGAAFRWDTILYGGTIVADLLFGGAIKSAHHGLGARVRVVLLWGFAACISWLVILKLTGYDPASVLRIVGRAGPVWEDLSWTTSLSRIHTLFTPAFVVLCSAGTCVLLRKKHPLVAIAPFALVLPGTMVLHGSPKWFITALPSLIAVACAGLSGLWHRPRDRYALIGLALLPWIVGVRVALSGIAWGPRFELQAFNMVPEVSSWPSVSVGAGMAIPTPEGPRPLFGHAWVLGGEWKRFVEEYWLEQRNAVSTGIRMNAPVLLHGHGDGWGVVAYSALGFTTEDPNSRAIDNEFVVERRWSRPDGANSRLLSLVHANEIFDPDSIDRLQRVSGETVVIMAYPHTVARLQKLAPNSLESLGKVTAVLHLHQLSMQLREARSLVQ